MSVYKIEGTLGTDAKLSLPVKDLSKVKPIWSNCLKIVQLDLIKMNISSG